MKHLKTFSLALLLLTGCRKNFADVVAKAEKEFLQKNYVGTIDTLNNGMALWRDSDGNDIKGHAFELLGKSYHQLRNTDKAMEAFEQAVNVSTNSAVSALTMGNIYLAQNRPELAEKSFNKALEMKPNDPMALLGLGNSCFLQKKTDDARDAFEKIIEVSPAVREALESLAVIKARRHVTPAPAVKRAPTRRPVQRKRR